MTEQITQQLKADLEADLTAIRNSARSSVSSLKNCKDRLAAEANRAQLALDRLADASVITETTPPPQEPPPTTPPPTTPPPTGPATTIQPGANVQTALAGLAEGATLQLGAGAWPDIRLSGIRKTGVTLEWLSGATGKWLGVSDCSGITFKNARLANGGVGLFSVSGDSHHLTFTGGDFGPHYADQGSWMTNVTINTGQTVHPGTNGPITFEDCKWHDLTRSSGNHTEGIALWGCRNVTLRRCRFERIAVYPVSIDRWPNTAGDGWNTPNSTKNVLLEDCYLDGPDAAAGIYTSDGVTLRRVQMTKGPSVGDGTYTHNCTFDSVSFPGAPGALANMSNVTLINTPPK